MLPDPAIIDALVARALEVRRHAYAPYSGFTVGAALLAVDGSTFVGCNVENSSYGLSVCAERHAIAAAVAAGATSFAALAVVTETSPPSTPCGACRQVLAEFGDFPVILANLAGERRIVELDELIPNPFRGQGLGRS